MMMQHTNCLSIVKNDKLQAVILSLYKYKSWLHVLPEIKKMLFTVVYCRLTFWKCTDYSNVLAQKCNQILID